VNFRLVTLNDIPVISNIFLECWKISYENLLPESVRDSMDETRAKNLWTITLSNNLDRETFMGLVDNQPIGFFRIGVDQSDESRGHLFSLYVSPQFAGMGYGKKLLAEAIRLIKEKKFSTMSLWVFEENIPARALYAKFDFEPSGKTKITPEWQLPEIEMVNSQLT